MRARRAALGRLNSNVGLHRSKMFSSLDPLVDFQCPRCHSSLRFRRVHELPGSTGSPNFLCACPECDGAIILRQHKAFPDDWRWMLFIAPGLLICTLAIFVQRLAFAIPIGVAFLLVGLLALIVYMISERWNWRCYVLPEEIAQQDTPADVPTSRLRR